MQREENESVALQEAGKKFWLSLHAYIWQEYYQLTATGKECADLVILGALQELQSSDEDIISEREEKQEINCGVHAPLSYRFIFIKTVVLFV